MKNDKIKYAKWRVKHLSSFLKQIPREVWSATKQSLKSGELVEACLIPFTLPPYALIFYLTYFDEYETPPWKEKPKANFDKPQKIE